MGRRKNSESILITGVTGWVGRHLLKEALNNDSLIVVLIRPNGVRTPVERLRDLGFSVDDTQKICIIESVQALDALSKKPTLIIHCAANVDFVNDEMAEKSNLGLTWDLLTYAASIHKFRQFIFTSTLSIRGDGKGVFSEDSLDLGQNFITPYALTKFLAEILVRRFHRDVPFCIVRIGTVMGWSDDGVFGVNMDWFLQSVRLWLSGLFSALPIATQQKLHLITPVILAKGLWCLTQIKELPPVLHMPADPGPCARDIFCILAEKVDKDSPLLLSQNSSDWSEQRRQMRTYSRQMIDKLFPPPPSDSRLVEVDSSFSEKWFKKSGICLNTPSSFWEELNLTDLV